MDSFEELAARNGEEFEEEARNIYGKAGTERPTQDKVAQSAKMKPHHLQHGRMAKGSVPLARPPQWPKC